MYHLFFVLLVVGCPVGFVHCRSLITVQLETGEWLAVKEIARGREYWLYPRPEVLTASFCQSCTKADTLTIGIRFWKEDLLERVRLGLKSQGRCAGKDPCRIAPYPATRILLRDSNRYFRTVGSAVQGFIPPFMSFSIVSMKFTNKSSLKSSLIFQKLKTLEIDVISSSGSADVRSKQLVVTGLDMELALRLLPAKQNKVIDKRNLERLIDLLLKIKARHLDGSTTLQTSQREMLRRQLTTSSMEYSSEIKDFLPAGYSAKEGEVVYTFRQMKTNEQVVVSLEENAKVDTVTVGVTIRQGLTNADSLDLEDPLPTPTGNSSLLLLQRQVEKLAMLANAENLLSPTLMNLRAIDDCYDVKQQRLKAGVFYLRPLKRAVMCTADGYLEALRRSGDGTNFNVSRAEYESGIGSVGKGDYFIGLEALSQLTLRDDLCMFLKLYPWRLDVTLRTANYDSFVVSSRKDDYRLSYAAFNGTALTDILSSAKGQAFSTFDKDLDNFVGSCSKKFASGNWYSSCRRSNIFGPYLPNAFNGMCSVGMAKSQGTMCSPLNRVQMLLRKKSHSPKSTKIVFSIIASPINCSSTLHLLDVPETGSYRITAGGGPGGLSPKPGTRPGGRGAKLTATFRLEKGSTLALSAGCRGGKADYGGYGGSASWIVLRPKGVLLAVAGGGGGAGR